MNLPTLTNDMCAAMDDTANEASQAQIAAWLAAHPVREALERRPVVVDEEEFA